MKLRLNTAGYIKYGACVVLVSVWITHIYWMDGVFGALGELFTGSTDYAPGYSEAKYRRIHVGMREDEVRSVMGEPLRKYINRGVEVWAYSLPRYKDKDGIWGDCNHTVRSFFFKYGRVIEIYHEFYID